jgi:pimeloyl-ACP methyl ester carboxylesterase
MLRMTVGLTIALTVLLSVSPTTRTGSSVLAATPGGEAPQSAQADIPIVPFKINVPDSVLADLKARLALTRFPEEINGAGWDYGTNLAYMKEFVAYWRDKYDWRAQERRLNQLPQFKARIDGLDIHFVHQPSKVPNAMPLLLLNGYPSSIDEYSKVIGPLTDPVAFGGRAEDAFHVVIPSMPGYGFSDKPTTRGYEPGRVVQHWAKLMARLGYSRYIAQGTDWGLYQGIRLALQDKAHMVGLLLSDCPQTPLPGEVVPPSPAAGRIINAGHSDVLSSRPQTVGYALDDSPVGLAAWILDKYYIWPDNDNNIEKRFTKDELLTNIMIWWVTKSGTSGGRIYYEGRRTGGQVGAQMIAAMTPKLPEERVEVPTGCTAFLGREAGTANAGRDPIRRRWAEARYNVVRWAEVPEGGHFPAAEVPTLYVNELRAFLRSRR